MNIRNSEPESAQAVNPFSQALERMVGLAKHWGDGSGGNGLGTAEFRTAVEESRNIWVDAAQEQVEIARRAQKKIVESMAGFAGARSPQDIAKRQAEIVALIAEAGAEHSAVWAQCCRSITEECATFLDKAGQRAERSRQDRSKHSV